MILLSGWKEKIAICIGEGMLMKSCLFFDDEERNEKVECRKKKN